MVRILFKFCTSQLNLRTGRKLLARDKLHCILKSSRKPVVLVLLPLHHLFHLLSVSSSLLSSSSLKFFCINHPFRCVHNYGPFANKSFRQRPVRRLTLHDMLAN